MFYHLFESSGLIIESSPRNGQKPPPPPKIVLLWHRDPLIGLCQPHNIYNFLWTISIGKKDLPELGNWGVYRLYRRLVWIVAGTYSTVIYTVEVLSEFFPKPVCLQEKKFKKNHSYYISNNRRFHSFPPQLFVLYLPHVCMYACMHELCCEPGIWGTSLIDA